MKNEREIVIPDIDYQAEVKKCKTMEYIVGKNGLMQKLFKDVIQQLLEAEMEELYGIDVSPSMISKITDKVVEAPPNGKAESLMKYIQLYIWMQCILR